MTSNSENQAFLGGLLATPAQTPVAAPEPQESGLFGLFGDDSPEQENEAGTEAHSAPNAVLEVIGKVQLAKLEPIPYELNDRQKRTIELYSRNLHVAKELVTGQAVWDLWPQGYANGRVSKSITDPTARARAARAGQRPMIGNIQGYLESTEYSEQMKELGIEVNTKETGLTAEQMGLITHFSNFTDGKNIRQKLKDVGITWAKYQAWRSQPVFSRYYEQIMGDAIRDAMPFAKQQIAAKMGAGDMNAIKFGMELSGEYDPRGQQQIDAKALLTVLLEVMEEKIQDQQLLLDIASTLQIRSQALRVKG